MVLMSLSRKAGKMVWWLFLLIFFAAFQIVLLYLFGKGVIAVDMFLNLVTTNPGEAMELLDNLIPGVASVFILYLPLLVLGVVSIRNHNAPVLSLEFRKRCRKWAAAIALVGCGCVAVANATIPCYSVLDDMYPANVFYNSPSSAIMHPSTTSKLQPTFVSTLKPHTQTTRAKFTSW